MDPSEATAPEVFFLELTFNGGRFSSHSLPVDVVGELATVQQLIEKVAHHLFLEQNEGKRRVPKGFFDAAQLYLAASADNCFTAKLRRPPSAKLGLFESTLFDTARNLVLSAIAAIAIGQALPTEFPADAIETLSALGRRLEDDESLIMRDVSSAVQATVTQATRKKFAEQCARPLETIATLDGEIELFNDERLTALLRTKTRERVEIGFERIHKDRLVGALKNRPLERVRVRGKLIQTQSVKRMQSIDDLDVMEDERAPEIQKIWDRLRSFEQIKNGWFDGGGLAPTHQALTRAKDVLARLLVDYANIPRPRVYPTPAGGIQAEWVLNDWVADLMFDAGGNHIQGEATQTVTGAEHSQDFDEHNATPTDVKEVAAWLAALT